MASTLNSVKAFIKRTPLYPPIRGYFQRKRYRDWVARGKVGQPPHRVKQLAVQEYAERFGTRVMVETGTYLGDMIDAVKNRFDHVYSVELGDELYKRARHRFANDPRVTILHGDSGEKILEILPVLKVPTLFWLDAHYTAGLGVSGRGIVDTPVLAELSHIFKHPLAHQHVILIDDAHEFTGQNDYPALNAVESLVKAAGYDHFEVKDNSIRIYKARGV